MAARRQLDELGIDRDNALMMSQEYSPTGLPNPDYNPNVGSLVRKAVRRMYGDDPEQEEYLGRIFGGPGATGSDVFAAPAPEEAEPTPGGSPSLGQRIVGGVMGLFGGEETAQAGGAPAEGEVPALPTMRSGKIDRSKLRTGDTYELPDGRTVRWTGSDFELQ